MFILIYKLISNWLLNKQILNCMIIIRYTVCSVMSVVDLILYIVLSINVHVCVHSSSGIMNQAFPYIYSKCEDYIV